MSDNNGFFDANPKMLFVFGLVCGIAITMVLGWALPNFSNTAPSGADQDVVIDATDTQPELVLAAVTDTDHIRGDISQAKVVLIEYSDFECPYCGRHNPTMIDLYDQYGTDIAWVYRHLPLTSIHPDAVPSALASECAGEQGKFWEFADELYANQDSLGDDYYTQLATDLGLDVDQFTSCYTSQKYLSKVEADMQSGENAGVTGTPATFVNGTLVAGAYPLETFTGMIDEILAQ
ncbi:thioredoxin domain-containing protein [Patescibacteria group bacterium]|nr:thioredoxin domain-containing protein [Patescibacteria group bacterium]MBU4453121.1 thioredoxin domain-containing protein [Patescibacteria group bacterium]MCG2687449.1 thioredoxin domain-containing protein [Candidatus Parcubacteria bacterium]